MKSTMKLGLLLSVSTVVTLVAARDTLAEPFTPFGGIICHKYNAQPNFELDYVNSTVRNLNPAQVNVVCPLVRDTTNTNGAKIWVNTTGGAITCSANSFEWDGKSIKGVANIGKGSILFDLTGAGNSSATSNYMVSCRLPANDATQINSLFLEEQ